MNELENNLEKIKKLTESEMDRRSNTDSVNTKLHSLLSATEKTFEQCSDSNPIQVVDILNLLMVVDDLYLFKFTSREPNKRFTRFKDYLLRNIHSTLTLEEGGIIMASIYHNVKRAAIGISKTIKEERDE